MAAFVVWLRILKRLIPGACLILSVLSSSWFFFFFNALVVTMVGFGSHRVLNEMTKTSQIIKLGVYYQL